MIKTMRVGKYIGTLKWRTREIPVIGSEKDWITDSIRNEMRRGEGVVKNENNIHR
jgi:hypothetical protein